MTNPPADRVAVVTGASRGIDKGIALELGAAVYLTDAPKPPACRPAPSAPPPPRWPGLACTELPMLAACTTGEGI